MKAQVIAPAELDDDIDWNAQVDATIVRTHQHAAGAANPTTRSPTGNAAVPAAAGRRCCPSRRYQLVSGNGRPAVAFTSVRRRQRPRRLVDHRPDPARRPDGRDHIVSRSRAFRDFNLPPSR
jgi:hypothetical protein